ncbi:MAG: Alg9-like mannosyltransferase family-domain-containing protein [Linnemannia elongata]|nr:MAG: Alg9-like mannosyltransferase family-domain-containing protein [Linnemannia elongata]
MEKEPHGTSTSSSWRFRLFIAFSPGYIHPDEFFQSAEITAGNVFGFKNDIPWEYQPELPCRSIIIPAITTGIPYLFLKRWVGTNPDHFVNSRTLFLTQRLAFVLVSLIIDWSIVNMARQIRRSPSIALLLVASSYVTLAYHTHPFSNTVETLILALSAVVLGKIIQQHETSTTLPSTTLSKSTTASHPSSASASSVLPSTGPYQPRPSPIHLTFLLGVLFAVGTFTRITFAVFGFPFGVMLLYLNAKASFWKGRSTLRGLVAFIQACMPLAIGLGSMSAAAIFIDSIYFGKLVISRQPHGSPMTLVEIFSTSPLSWPSLSVQGSPTLTMWNNLQYNLDKDNLALHGLHPRFFHLLLNFPVLFGNLAWIGLSTIIRKVVAREWSSRSKLVTGTFISPPLWLVLNGVLAIVFGVIHQAGLVPAMDLIQTQSLGFQDCRGVGSGDHILCTTDPLKSGVFHPQDNNTYVTRVIFYKTYMPPYHLFGYNEPQAHSHGVYLKILDWRSKSKDELIESLFSKEELAMRVERTLLSAARKEHQQGQRPVIFRETGPRQYERTVLVAPGTVDFSEQAFDNDGTKDRISRHANFDHMPELMQRPLTGLSMNVYYL